MSADLFGRDLFVLNLGLSGFADALKDTGGTAVDIDWRPPAGGSRDIGATLDRIAIGQTRGRDTKRQTLFDFTTAGDIKI